MKIADVEVGKSVTLTGLVVETAVPLKNQVLVTESPFRSEIFACKLSGTPTEVVAESAGVLLQVGGLFLIICQVLNVFPVEEVTSALKVLTRPVRSLLVMVAEAPLPDKGLPLRLQFTRQLLVVKVTPKLLEAPAAANLTLTTSGVFAVTEQSSPTFTGHEHVTSS